MEVEAMSSALAGIQIHISVGDGRRIRGRETTRPLRLKREVKTKALVNSKKKKRIRRDENQPPTPTQENLRPPDGDFEEEDSITMYRRTWDRRRRFDITLAQGRRTENQPFASIGPMCYTSEPPTPENLFREQTVKIFSIRVRSPTDGLKWPLHVLGYVATRDSMDHNRNYLFRRTRDNCQTITQKDPCLLLTGPSRAVVYLDPITFEVHLKVKGEGESQDKMLAFGVFYYGDGNACARKVSMCVPYKRCTLEYEVALRPRSVEATISVKVIDGSWPENHHGQVVALTSGLDGEVILLHFRDGEVPVGPDGANRALEAGCFCGFKRETDGCCGCFPV
ncbi:hypothetical protein ZWY2020_011960 [Hordeum vulgare]|nr:hypothetical protein ZWY2020_011960 [Hordeum vulgare]